MNTITLQGILYDEKSSFQKGPAQAPPIIRNCLHGGSFNYFTELDVNIENRYIDAGDFPIKSYFDIESITEIHLEKGHKLLTLGGDHSITYPIIKAYQKYYPRLDILQIDAHADLYHDFEGDPYSHACPFARIMENGLAVRLVQIGIRTLTPHQIEQSRRFNTEIHEMRNLSNNSSSILKNLGRFNNPLYISLDMDCFDPAFAPGVSHHEAGGLASRQVLDLIHNLDADIIGADIVEYNPKRDHNKMTAYLAAKMLKELLGKMI